MSVPLVVMPRALSGVMPRGGSWGRDGLALPLGGRDDGVEHAEVVQSFGQARAARQSVQAGDLIQEGPRLEGEEIVLPMADAGKVHREAAGDIRVGGPD